MDSIERLASVFEKFPGIGPRQAGRFVQFLLRSSPSVRQELIESIRTLGTSVRQCSECMRHHSASKAKPCDLCADSSRDNTLLVVVASDTDLTALEKSGTYRGRYFVLGGTIDLATDDTKRLRIKQLLARISGARKNSGEPKEIILAFPANPEGDATAARLRDDIMGLRNPYMRVSVLGRGLSTGSELEYADSATIKAALEGRH